MTQYEREPEWGGTVEQGVPAAPDRPDVSMAPTYEALAMPLARLRSRARALLVAQRVGLILAALIAAGLVMALADVVLRLPMSLRVMNLTVGVAAVGVAIARFVVPAVRFRPSLTDVALRVEGSRPELKGRLASALDFAREASQAHNAQPAMSRALAAAVVRDAARSWRASDITDLLRPGRAARNVGAAVAAAALALAPMLVSPAMWSIGAERLLMPWTGAKWPARTDVADATNLRVHPLGRALPLRAAVIRTDRAWDNTDVVVRYRLIDERGEAGPVRRELLTWQKRETSVVEDDRSVLGQVFERLIEPAANVVEYRFETSDDQTPWRRISLVEPPSIARAQATVTPPAYAAALVGASASGAESGAVRLDLGPGTDNRAVAPPSLAGSRVDLTITLNHPASLAGDGLAPLLALDPGAQIELPGGDSTTLRAGFVLVDSLRLALRLVEPNGIESVEDAVYRFEATPDRLPAATITQPSADRSVLATASLEVVGEGRDDVGLAWTSVERIVARPAGRPGSEPSGPGGAMDEEPMVELSRTDAQGRSVVETRLMIELSPLGLHPGDEVRLTAVAADVLAMHDAARQPTRSAVRTLRIISEQQFVQELRAELSEVRQAAQRIDSQQGDLQTRTARDGADRAARRGQSQVTERLARQGQTLERVNERLAENALDDPALRDLLAEVGAGLERAGAASSAAAAGLEQAAADSPDAEQDSESLTPEEARQIGGSQEEVREELASVIQMLDRGEDAWVVRNTIERLVREQKGLAQDTARTGQATAGRPAESLSMQERSELSRIVEQQNSLADQTARLLEEMRQREEQLRQNDPSTAQGMSRAGQMARESQVVDRMREAANQAAQNQASTAGQSQQQAAQALEQMLEAMNQGERQRDAALRRALQSLIESLESLIRTQRGELAALEQAIEVGGALEGLDAAMITLNQNTMQVAEQAGAAGGQAAPVAALIGRAGEAQGRAIRALRSQPPAGPQAQEHEVRSLELLSDALKKARELEEQAADRERREKLRELRAAYRKVLELQAAVRSETIPFAERDELNRRDRVLVRQLGERQDAIREELAQMVKNTRELTEAGVFDLAHRRLDAQTKRAADLLDNANAIGSLPAQDSILATLRGLLEALEDDRSDQKFSESAGGGEGGGGGGEQQNQLIPPVRELKLLRSLQVEVAETTVMLENLPGATPRDLLEELARSQRELSAVGDDLVKRVQSGGNPRDVFPGLDGEAQPAPPGRGLDDPIPLDPVEPDPEAEPASPSAMMPQRAVIFVAAAHQSAPAPTTPEPQPNSGTPPPAKRKDELPSLDDALGLPPTKPSEEAASPADGAVDPDRAELERKLSADEAAEAFVEAVRQMSETADRIERIRDTGLVTQRLQQDIIRKLEILIKSAEQQQSQSSSSSSSSQQQQQQQQGQQANQPQQQQSQPADGQQDPGAGEGGGNPAFAQGEREQLNAARAAWGALPDRLRETFLDGMDDYYSKMYESMTESYYRKAAENARERP